MKNVVKLVFKNSDDWCRFINHNYPDGMVVKYTPTARITKSVKKDAYGWYRDKSFVFICWKPRTLPYVKMFGFKSVEDYDNFEYDYYREPILEY